MTDPARPEHALPLAGGWCWFDRVEVISRRGSGGLVPVTDLPKEVVVRLSSPRPPILGLDPARPRIMGILNVTPDSFSDGGRFEETSAAVAHARAMVNEGADIVDIGGESTRPGAAPVSIAEEIARTVPVIVALAKGGFPVPISIDTRKAAVAEAALQVGAGIVNDVSALGYDPQMAEFMGQTDSPVCLMHAQGAPETMQADPQYEDVLLDVYDYLASQIAKAEAAGIDRRRIIADPGIGFGKTQDHNLALLSGISLFHGLGCTLLLGASRKRFIGTIGHAGGAEQRVPGTLAVTLAALGQGVQIHRVHDIAELRQGLRLWLAVTLGEVT